MSDIKKFLNILSETTTSGAVAPVSGAVGNSVLKRPADSIFAAEDSHQENSGPEEAPPVSKPSDFGLWKNSVLAGKEQKKSGKKVDLKSKEMYPQLKEARDRDAYERDYDHSVAGMDKRSNRAYQADGGANDEGWGKEQPSSGQWYIMINGQSEKSGKMYSSNIEAHRRGEAIKQIYRDKGYKVPRIDVIQSKTFEESKIPSKLDIPAPRNFVAKNAINTGAGKHKDKKKAEKQGDFKHKNKQLDMNEGYTVIPGIDREKYVERPGLEGPFGTKSGKTVYYDPREGKYYDPDTDMYIEYDDWQAMNEQGVAEGSGPKEKQKTPYRDINSAEYRASAEKQKQQMTKDKLAEPGKKLLAKQGVAEGEWDGTGAADMAAATAQAAADTDSEETEKEISLSEEMIADRLKKELALFKKGSKSKDREISKKPADKEVHSKDKKEE